MAANDYLDFNVDNLPEEFTHDIDGVTYTMMIYYNDFNDSFYIDLYDANTPPVPIVLGERLVYGEPMWGMVTDPRLPMIQLVPIDDDGNANRVNSSNFPDIVRLEFMDTEVEPDDLLDADSDDTDTDDSDNADINQPGYTDGPDDDINLYGQDSIRSGGDK